MPDPVPFDGVRATATEDSRAPRRWLQAKDLLVVAALAGLVWQFGAAGGAAGGSAGARGTAAPAAPGPSTAAVHGGTEATLVGAVDAPTYAPGSPEREVFEALNEARARGNFGLLAQDVRLDAAAAAHADYMAQNLAGGVSHRQQAGRPGFTGETPRERIVAAGYDTVTSYEAISNGTSARGCLELLNTVYHLGALMAGATDVGIAVHPAAGCVIEPQVPARGEGLQRRRAGTVGVYPYPGQDGVPPAFMPATEVPNPAPELADAVVGPPILVDLNAAAAGGAAGGITIERFTLAEPGGASVPARLLAGPGVTAAGVDTRLDRRLAGSGQLFLLPLQPLRPGTTYSVEFAGTAAGHALRERWTFRTR